jgi:hypothetical protein
MKFLSMLLANCLNCSHYTPLYIENTWELSTCKKFNDRYADMCRYDEEQCGKKARYFLPKKVKDLLLDNPNNKNSSDGLGLSMELVCI